MFIDLSQEYPTAAYEIRSIFESRVDRERSASSCPILNYPDLRAHMGFSPGLRAQRTKRRMYRMNMHMMASVCRSRNNLKSKNINANGS